MNNYINEGNMIKLGITCDVCGRSVQGIIVINGMKFCARCYAHTYGIPLAHYKDNENKEVIELLNAQYIEQLKQENAQLNEDIKHYKKEIQKSNVGIAHLKNQLKQEKEKLVEKDKEISKLSKEHLEMFGDMKDYKNLWLAEQRKNKEIRHQVCEEIKEKLCRIEDTLINLGNGKEDALNYFVKILNQVEKETDND